MRDWLNFEKIGGRKIVLKVEKNGKIDKSKFSGQKRHLNVKKFLARSLGVSVSSVARSVEAKQLLLYHDVVPATSQIQINTQQRSTKRWRISYIIINRFSRFVHKHDVCELHISGDLRFADVALLLFH